MFEKICFRLMTINEDKPIEVAMKVIKSYGIKVFDLRAVDSVNDDTGEVVDTFALLCCCGSKRKYEKLKKEHELIEFTHENILTLR